jgi:cysteinyl-tRNA synthetase
VYFRVKKFQNYGALSHQKLDELRHGVNIEEDALKEDPLDFAIWKSAKPNEPVWDSPWGEGRPGWHIEDTAITQKEFGAQYELHGGARDLIFPHHEAEIALMETAYGKRPMVHTWLHTGFLQIKGEKMSKSLKNFITIREILKKHSPQTLRVLFTTRHYRSPMDYSEEALEEAHAVQRRIGEFWTRLREAEARYGEAKTRLLSVQPKLETDKRYSTFVEAFWKELEDDFNTPAAFSHVFSLINYINPKIDNASLAATDTRAIITFLEEMNAIFGVVDKEALAEPEELPESVQHMIDERDRLREEKKWDDADLIRQELEEQGYEVKDSEGGTVAQRKRI